MKYINSTLNRNEVPQAENINRVERVVRVLTAAAMLAPIFFLTGTIGWEAYFALGSVYFALTGLLGFDPLYAWFDTGSKRKPNQRRSVNEENNQTALTA